MAVVNFFNGGLALPPDGGDRGTVAGVRGTPNSPDASDALDRCPEGIKRNARRLRRSSGVGDRS